MKRHGITHYKTFAGGVFLELTSQGWAPLFTFSISWVVYKKKKGDH
jgi:hypothetical protein